MLPHDAEAERAVLGAVFLDNRVLDEVRAGLKREDFFVRRHAEIFEAMVESEGHGDPIDEVTVAARIKSANESPEQRTTTLSELMKLVDVTPTAANVGAYIEKVERCARSRRLLEIGSTLNELASLNEPDEAIQRVTKEIYDLAEVGRGRMISTSLEAARLVMGKLDSLLKNNTLVTGVPTGFEALDKILCGLQPGNLVVIGARPGCGKTAFAMNIMSNASVRHGQAILFVELEMSTTELAMRWLSSLARVNGSRSKRGSFGEYEFSKFGAASTSIQTAKVVFDETPSTTLVDLRLQARKMKTAGALDLIIIDYLQLMQSVKDRDNREREIAEISRGLKMLAKELSIPIVVLSQLNRSVEQRGDKRPMLSDLRESGAIEQDADVIMFLYRDELYNKESPDQGIAEVLVAKHRNGPTGVVRLRFDVDTQRFDHLPEGSNR